ncbi:MAG: acetyltransferase [Pseudomonadales bacterium]
MDKTLLPLLYAPFLAITNMVIRTLISAVSLTAITLNLVLWCVPLSLVVVLQLLIPPFRPLGHRLVAHIYRMAVWINSFWIQRILGVRIILDGDPPPGPETQHLVVVSNHRSWFDILVIQHIITGLGGPMLKFLVKRQLIYVPVVGWICLALDFPKLNRSKDQAGREQDYQSIQNASEQMLALPGALMNFAEGTRFSLEKRQARGSDYDYLLNPKSGGLRIILASIGPVAVIDVTLVYPDDDINFWQILGGSLERIDVHLHKTSSADIADESEWLANRWRMKDELIRAKRLKDTHL